jgi:hypothetical protein|tara:strand:- start:21004 stop:21177 length:174 start_codon:yes stop_codon:yes gene_type:complete
MAEREGILISEIKDPIKSSPAKNIPCSGEKGSIRSIELLSKYEYCPGECLIISSAPA